MTTTLYGIKNCDTIKKAQKWLKENNIEFTFHDYRVDGIDQSWLEQQVATFGIDLVLNKRGTTYRQLSDETKQNLTEQLAIELMVESPAMIKRPILLSDNTQIIGFKAADYQQKLL